MASFASSACMPTCSSRLSMCVYSCSAARATAGSGFHSVKEAYSLSPMNLRRARAWSMPIDLDDAQHGGDPARLEGERAGARARRALQDVREVRVREATCRRVPHEWGPVGPVEYPRPHIPRRLQPRKHARELRRGDAVPDGGADAPAKRRSVHAVSSRESAACQR